MGSLVYFTKMLLWLSCEIPSMEKRKRNTNEKIEIFLPVFDFFILLNNLFILQKYIPEQIENYPDYGNIYHFYCLFFDREIISSFEVKTNIGFIHQNRFEGEVLRINSTAGILLASFQHVV
jgi:hypothetical protein